MLSRVKQTKLLKRMMGSKSGFISVLALGVLVNAVILAVGVTIDTSKLRQNQKTVENNVEYEETINLRQMADEVWMKYHNVEHDRPVKFLSSGYTVKLPKRDMYGYIIEEPTDVASGYAKASDDKDNSFRSKFSLRKK